MTLRAESETTMTADQLKAMYERWLLELWHGRLDAVDEVVAPEFLVHQARSDGRSSEELRGPAAVRELVASAHAPFSRLEFSIEVGPLVDGEFVAARWSGRGTYAGGIPGASAPVGTEVTFADHDILRAQDGRFVEYWVTSDGLALMEQLGALG